MQEIIFATGSENKMREIREIFEGPPFVIHSLKEAGLISDPEEDGTTFVENTFIRTEAVHALRPNAIMMSGNSGLSTDYLNGEPGASPTRWLGRDTSYIKRNAELIRRLEGVEGDVRSARFAAVIVCILPGGARLLTGAHMEGRIAKAPTGEGGFGYNPILYLLEYGKCSAESSEHEKNMISHHGKALRQARKKLQGIHVDAVDEGMQFGFIFCGEYGIIKPMRSVARSGRVPALGTGCCRPESYHPNEEEKRKALETEPPAFLRREISGMWNATEIRGLRSAVDDG